MTTGLSPEQLHAMDAYWRVANYLSVGQIYLLDNPLLQQPLVAERVKSRLLGHWGTTPGLNFIYVHLNRLITQHDLNMIYIIGPGHSGPGIVANAYLEGTTTPFDMVVRNDLDRFQLVGDVIDRVSRLGYLAAYVKQTMRDKLIAHKEYIVTYSQDMPEILNWRWPSA